MKKLILTMLISGALILSPIFLCSGFASSKPRLGVLRFTNNTHAGWWSGSVGRDLQDMLIAELAAMKSFSVLERKEIDAVLQEQDFGTSGRISKATRAKMGKIKGAQYLVAATVSAFESGTSGTGGGLSYKGFSLGGKKKTAYMAVDLKLIDTTTGEIADVRTVEATAKSGGLGLGIHKWGFGGSLKKEKKTPTGKAIRACIMEIAEYLDCSLIMGRNHSCMDDYDAKDSRRREKTKGAIELD
jgi:curli biogenesis system outer membrane secretion channel CsgG